MSQKLERRQAEVTGNQDVAANQGHQPCNTTIIAGQQVVGKEKKLAPLSPEPMSGKTNITIGEALEATALAGAGRPVDYSDAAAIQAAEVRATGCTNIVPDGLAAAAQSAATRNARALTHHDKTKIGHILSDTCSNLPCDKAVTQKDAEGIIGAELRNDPNLCTHPGGVAASIVAAARLNQNKSDN